MKLAQISGGIVANIIEVDPAKIPAWCADWPDATGAQIGWTWDGQTYADPNPPTDPKSPADPVATP